MNDEVERTERIMRKLEGMSQFLKDHPGITIQQTIDRLITAELAVKTARVEALEEAAREVQKYRRSISLNHSDRMIAMNNLWNTELQEPIEAIRALIQKKAP